MSVASTSILGQGEQEKLAQQQEAESLLSLQQSPAQSLLSLAGNYPSASEPAQSLSNLLSNMGGFLGHILNIAILASLTPILESMPGISPRLSNAVTTVATLGILTSVISLLTSIMHVGGKEQPVSSGLALT